MSAPRWPKTSSSGGSPPRGKNPNPPLGRGYLSLLVDQKSKDEWPSVAIYLYWSPFLKVSPPHPPQLRGEKMAFKERAFFTFKQTLDDRRPRQRKELIMVHLEEVQIKAFLKILSTQTQLFLTVCPLSEKQKADQFIEAYWKIESYFLREIDREKKDKDQAMWDWWSNWKSF
jgi:hypothetical protein